MRETAQIHRAGVMTTANKDATGSKLHDGGLQRLHFADDIALNWLEGMAMKALAR